MLFTLLAALAFVGGCGDSKSPADPGIESLVSAEWLNEHLDDPDLVVLDCSVQVDMGADGKMTHRSGRTGYEAGHVPSAGFADLIDDLSDVDSPLHFALPTAERFCEAMGALGVGDGSKVVLYDGTNSAWAARVWWMLRWVGFDDAAVLDGGWAAWNDGERPVATEPSSRTPARLTPHPRPALVADRDEVFAALDDDTVTLIDAMPEPHYLGMMVLYDRPGHIPGAVNISVMTILDDTGRFRPHEELATLFEVDRDTRAIVYCGAGVAASADAFVMHRLGFTDVAVYMASLQEWAADPDTPLTVDAP
jgi:thiosulfate/3-mercaptopyruvate sulfurtransferase